MDNIGINRKLYKILNFFLYYGNGQLIMEYLAAIIIDQVIYANYC